MAMLTETSPIAVNRWAAVAGTWHFQHGLAEYDGPLGEGMPFGLALSDVQLRDGAVTARVCFEADRVREATGGIVLGYQADSQGYVVAALGGFERAYTITEYDPSRGWQLVSGAGSIANLEGQRAYLLEVHQMGQRVALSVDGIPLLKHVMAKPLPGNQLGLFSYGRVKTTFSEVEARVARPRVFVAMQFSEPYDTLYHHVIKPVIEDEEFNLEVVRIDEKAGPGIIFEDIKNEIAESQLVIAEITAPNENVFYELGYAHALNKPTVLLAQRGKELPFDIRSYRVIFYDDTIGGKPEVEDNLKRHLRAILRKGD